MTYTTKLWVKSPTLPHIMSTITFIPFNDCDLSHSSKRILLYVFILSYWAFIKCTSESQTAVTLISFSSLFCSSYPCLIVTTKCLVSILSPSCAWPLTAILTINCYDFIHQILVRTRRMIPVTLGQCIPELKVNRIKPKPKKCSTKERTNLCLGSFKGTLQHFR